jgi:hypothetical protein
MELPNTVFIAVGVVAAAMLTGVFSFISLINQKEGKISEFRQNWIDAIRNDLAKMTASFDRMCASWQLVKIQTERDGSGADVPESLNRFYDLVKDDLIVFSECHQRILMRLNRNQHADLIDELRQTNDIISQPNVLCDTNAVDLRIKRIIELSQDLLKEEWEVVKAGEQSYRMTKMTVIVSIAILVLSVICIIMWNF